MRDELNEIYRLKKLLTTARLTVSDRTAIANRLQDLKAASQKPKREPLSPYLLGTFDRPAPSPDRPTGSEALAPQPPSLAVPAESDAGEPEVPSKAEPPVAQLSKDEVESRCKLLSDISDRIMLLRAVWANTLSFEVARETEAWLKKLQDVAETIAREAA